MKKEHIKEMVTRNNAKRNSIYTKLRLAASHIISTNDIRDFYFDAINKSYFGRLQMSQMNVESDNIYCYNKFELEYKGCKLIAAYDFYCQTIEAKIIIPENNSHPDMQIFIHELKCKRQMLKNDWIEMVSQVAKDYFNINKKNYVKYPTVTCPISKLICIWTNGDDNVKPCHKMRELLHQSINHTMEEYLNEQYYIPVLWDSNEQTENVIVLKDGFRLHLKRDKGITPNLSNYPAIFMHFEMTQSDDDAFHCFLECKREQKRADEYAHFMDFVTDFKTKATWMSNENGEIENITPIIYQDDAEFILRMAEKTYGDDYKFDLVKREIPLFDTEPHKCIRAILK